MFLFLFVGSDLDLSRFQMLCNEVSPLTPLARVALEDLFANETGELPGFPVPVGVVLDEGVNVLEHVLPHVGGDVPLGVPLLGEGPGAVEATVRLILQR